MNGARERTETALARIKMIESSGEYCQIGGRLPSGFPTAKPAFRITNTVLKHFRLLILIVAGAWLLLGAAPSPRAEVRMDVFYGYGNFVRQDNWFPVVCEVRNEADSNFEGRIEIRSDSQKSSRQVELELPVGTLKRVVVPVYCKDGDRDWSVRLVGDRDRKSVQDWLRSRDLRVVDQASTIMGSVSRTYAGRPVFPKIKQENEREYQPEVGHISTDLFPTTPIALEGLGSLYLHSERALDLSKDQYEALSAWVAFGGHLVMTIGNPVDLTATEWLQPLSPFLPEELGQISANAVAESMHGWLRDEAAATVPAPTLGGLVSDLERNGKYAYRAQLGRFSEFNTDSKMSVVRGQQLDGKLLLESAGGIPLIITAERGRGRVTVLTFNSETEPFRSWKGRPFMWAKLNRLPGFWFEQDIPRHWEQKHVDGLFGSLLESRQIREIPVVWLLGLLLIYLLFIGPIDYLVLKKLNRQMLTWITFPTYVVFFSVLIYYIGYRLRAGDVEWNEFHVVDVMERNEEAVFRGRSYLAIYSPDNRDYRIASSLEDFSLRPESNWQSGEFSSVDLVSGKQADLTVPVWMNRLYVADWTRVDQSPLGVRLIERDGGEITLELQNRSRAEMPRITVAWRQRFHVLKGLAPGERRTEKLLPSQDSFFFVAHGEDSRQYRFDIRDEDRLYSDHRSLSELYDSILQYRSHGGAMGGMGMGGRERNRLNDLSGHPMAFSFLSHARRRVPQADSRNNNSYLEAINSPAGLDLSTLLDHDQLVIQAYIPDFSLLEPLNQFEAFRGSRHTLLRTSLALPAASTP